MANQLLLPDYYSDINNAYDRGRSLSLNDLAAKAYNTPAGQQRDALVGQAIGVDRNSGMQLGNDLQSMQDARDAKLGAAARYVLNAYQTGNKAATEGAYQAVRPFLQSLHSSMGATTPAPANFSDDMLPAINEIVARTAGALNAKTPAAIQTLQYLGQGLSPDEQEHMRRVKAGLDPRASNPSYTKYEIPDGQGGKILALLNNRTGKFESPDYSSVHGGYSEPTASPDDINARISAAVNSGEMTPEQGDAAIAQAYQDSGYSVGGNPPIGGGLGYTPPKKPGNGNAFRQLTADEVKKLGLPDGTVAQQDSTGKVDIISKPTQSDAKLQAQARQAKIGLSGTLSQLDRLKAAATDLKNDPGLGGITGMTGRFPNAPGSSATRAEAKLSTLRSQIGFGVLQNMREMSKTGGALGSVSDKENELLQNNLASLDTKQSTEDFLQSLDKVIQYVDDSKARLQGAYNTNYGDVKSDQQSAPGENASIDDLLSKYGAH